MSKFKVNTLYKKSYYYLPFILTIFNSLLFTSNSKAGGLAIIKGITILFVVLVGYFFYLRRTKITPIIFLLAFYWLFLVLFSSSIYTSFWFFMKVILSILLLPIGLSISTEKSDYKLLYKSTLFILFFTVLFAIMSNVLHIGLNQYSRYNDTITVGLIDAQLYTPALACVAMLYFIDFFHFKSKTKSAIFVLIVLTFIVLLLSMRRTSVIIVILGSLSYYFLSKQFSKKIKSIILAIIILLLLFPLYKGFLIQRYELRAKFLNEKYSVDEELRYQETLILINDIKKSNSIKRLFFGKELFNSAGNYGNGVFGNRILHIDFNEILFGSGIIGLILYFWLYYILFKINKNTKNRYSRSIVNTFLILSFFISFSGQMYEVSFRSYLFVIIGSIIGLEKVVTKSVSKNRL